MKSIEIDVVDFEHIELPDTVYKYRDWSNEYHRTILTDYQVYMSPPLGFEDPLDCENLVRYDLLTSDEIYSKYYSESIRLSPQLQENEHKKLADYWFAKSPLHDKGYIKELQEKDFSEFNERIGILCLTANSMRPEMWIKYGADHKGFCVGFNPKIMFKYLGGGQEVKYCDELPIIKPAPWEDRTIQVIKQVYFKMRKWDFEEEYRTQKFSYYPLTKKARIVMLPIEAYKEIIFGASISDKHRNEIISIASKSIPKVEFKQSIIKDNNVILEKFQPN